LAKPSHRVEDDVLIVGAPGAPQQAPCLGPAVGDVSWRSADQGLDGGPDGSGCVVGCRVGGTLEQPPAPGGEKRMRPQREEGGGPERGCGERAGELFGDDAGAAAADDPTAPVGNEAGALFVGSVGGDVEELAVDRIAGPRLQGAEVDRPVEMLVEAV